MKRTFFRFCLLERASKTVPRKTNKQPIMISMVSLALLVIVILIKTVLGSVSFTSPIRGSLYAIGSQVTATLSGFTSGTTTISQLCETTPQTVDYRSISYPITSATFTLPAGFYGICTYVSSLDPRPEPVSIRVGNSVAISAPAFSTGVAAGDQFPITVTYTPDTDPNPVFDVILDCLIPGVEPVVEKIEGNAVNQFFRVPSDYYGSCELMVLNTVPSYYPTGSVGIIVITQLTLATPKDDANLVIGAPFNVLVTSPATTDNSAITLKFTSNPAQNIPANVNTVERVVLDSTYFGANSLIITATIPNIAPPPISITLKYALEFTQSPNVIVGDLPFQIYLTTSATPIAPADQSVTVYLTCGVARIDQWTVPLNQLSTLSVVFEDKSVLSNCFFSTPSDSIYYYKESQSVKIYTSPNGSPVNVLKSVEQNGFARSIAFPPSNILNRNIFSVNST